MVTNGEQFVTVNRRFKLLTLCAGRLDIIQSKIIICLEKRVNMTALMDHRLCQFDTLKLQGVVYAMAGSLPIARYVITTSYEYNTNITTDIYSYIHMCLILKSISFGSNIQSENRRNMQIDNHSAHIHDQPLSWLGT
jgi:hypothetical protein